MLYTNKQEPQEVLMAGRLRTIDARTLADAVLEPPGYAVKDLLVQGLHILAGAPKTGKSWLALWLCLCVSQGQPLWNFAVTQGEFCTSVWKIPIGASSHGSLT